MKMIEEWKTVLAKAWSMRLVLLIAVLGGLYAAVPSFSGLVSPGTMGITVTALAAALGVVRVINQGDASTWVAEWRDVLKKAWSMRLTYLLAVLGAAQAALPYFGDMIAPRTMGTATAVLALLVGTLRITDQNSDALTRADGGFSKAAPAGEP